MTDISEILRKHKLWLTDSPDGECANLSGANLRGANIDYSCWPLWCGSLGAKTDKRIATQIAYHFCRLDCDDPEYIKARNCLIDFANQFHRAAECGRLKQEAL